MTTGSESITYGSRNGAFSANLGQYQEIVDAALESWDRQQFTRLIWAKDPAPWKQPAGTKELVDRLGWLTVADTMIERLDELTGFAQEIRDSAFAHVVVLGMGGSSLSPEVSHLTFGSKPGFPKLLVLDSTVPQAVLDVEAQIDLANALFVVSSKSGGTIETRSAYRYFFDKLGDGRSFAAITDPGSWLQHEAGDRGFRRVFINMPDIGGRYSALSYFGLVPAALIGVDVKGMLESAREMMEECSDQRPGPNNPGVALGAIMAECAMRGRDKMTLLFSPEIESLGCWVEQLVAESTGKNGRGVLPVEGEPVGPSEMYGADRLFVYTKLKGAKDDSLDVKADALADAGHPLVTIDIENPTHIGQEYFRWEMATAVASALLAVNAFDQKNVGSSKKITGELIKEYEQKNALPAQTKLADNGILAAYADDETGFILDEIRQNGSYENASVEAVLDAHLRRFEPGNYVALMAFTRRTAEAEVALKTIRSALADHLKAAVTVGYGPRFLHSTGQFHKGGPNTGLFIQITADDLKDVPIPGEVYSFGALKDAQAMGDFISLREKGCRVLRIHLGADLKKGMNALVGIILSLTAK